MEKNYINEMFLLPSPLARELFHNYASLMPVIDYHNHLEAKDIWEDYSASNISECWLHHDHYLWRAMRHNGIKERFITGNATDKEKFEMWCQTMPYILGNPLYQWSHLELSRFFDCHLLINSKNCDAIWSKCTKVLSSGMLSYRSVLKQCNVEVLCTTDSPMSDLKYHNLLQHSDFEVSVLPTFRADELLAFDDVKSFTKTLELLTQQTGIDITSIDGYLAAISQRMDAFHDTGCRLSDLGLPLVEFESCTKTQAKDTFIQVLRRQNLENKQLVQLKTYVFNELGKQYHSRGWAMQLHIGVLANVNQRRKQELGAGTGFSVIHDNVIAESLTKLLCALDYSNQLPKTVLYSVNPNHNPILSCITGAFQDSDNAAGKIQFGAAWWFNDHKEGMEAQLTTLKNLGALGRFIGMLTDSRNVFSMSRHEYFRRVLCNQLAHWVEEGQIPFDEQLLKQTIENISYNNAKEYFNFPTKTV